MKIRNIDNGNELRLYKTSVYKGTRRDAIRCEFEGDDEYLVEYVYPTDTLEELLNDDGYTIIEEE